jgi:TrmH family RNA methyltransferase
MVSRNKANYIISLQKKKTREEEKLFVIEGDKLVREFLTSGQPVHLLVAKPEFIGSLTYAQKERPGEIITASYEELKRISSLKTPHNALALIPYINKVFNPEELFAKLSVALDCLQDPGNLGTIIRAAAWFGIENIVCSMDSVDVYNPKVIQASMGAILHVNLFYTDIKEYLHLASKKKIPVFGTLLKGRSIYNHKLDNKGVIILGNESRGISDDLLPYIKYKIMIPGTMASLPGIESLNVGMAASVTFSEFYRRFIRTPKK